MVENILVCNDVRLQLKMTLLLFYKPSNKKLGRTVEHHATWQDHHALSLVCKF